tara:strand:+ start:21717 stop:22820 length:1104 start_codon:yes stop_codon:yes gene_type:complete
MKKLLLTLLVALTILFAQAQCQADFSYMQNGPTTIFTDLSTVNTSWSTNYSVTWDWDFGDGNSSTQQNPVHTYANNGIYTPCLTVTYFDSTIINWCTSVYCDSILIGNSIPASWDCSLTTGCYDPGTGLGQYSSFASCDTMCGLPTPSWDCPTNTPGGCYDPGTGTGQYSSLSACQAVCGTPTPSWDCSAQGCYDPGTGNGQYSSLSACQAICVSTVSNACDSMTLISTGGSQQTMLVAEVPISFMDIHYWITTAPNGTVLGEDSMWNSHQIFNNTNNGQPYDTINICITYIDNAGYFTCCVTWFWNGSYWSNMGGLTSIGEIDSFDKKLIKVVDMLGRETSINNNQNLFFIYENGTIEKRYIVDRK